MLYLLGENIKKKSKLRCLVEDREILDYDSPKWCLGEEEIVQEETGDDIRKR